MSILAREENLTLLADFYEFTMGNGYLTHGYGDKEVTFDLFFRSIPDGGGYAITAGLEQAIDYIEHLHFSEEDLTFLKEKGLSEDFIDALRNFHFSCDLWAVPEGSVVFPGEPLIVVRGPVLQAQLLETMLLLTINHQSLIATKASRIVRSAKGRDVIEFGSRRAQGISGANLGARAAYIGGCVATANTLAERLFGVPAVGTMAHSWIQMFPTELEAFATYAKTYPERTLLLVDTYDTLDQGIPNAIRVFDEILKPLGHRPKGIRIDSGDIAYLSKEARKLLDAAGYDDCPIMASNSLDEFVIENLLHQGAKIDAFGVGERLITSKSSPVFGGVYKLTSVEREGVLTPTIKISENVQKITTPGFKSVTRFYDKETKKALADVVHHFGEELPEDNYEIFHPVHTWKRRVLKNFEKRELLVPIYEKGRLVYDLPSLDAIRSHAKKELGSLWEEMTRLENPQEYMVDLSEDLWKTKEELLASHGHSSH